MANVCALPIRYKAGAADDPHMLEAVRSLAEALEGSGEYQEFTRLAKAVNEDEQVNELLYEIRERHTLYRHAENGDLIAQLEALPVMRAYRAAEYSLRRLCVEIDQLVSQQAGLGFTEHIHPQGHG